MLFHTVFKSTMTGFEPPLAPGRQKCAHPGKREDGGSKEAPRNDVGSSFPT